MLSPLVFFRGRIEPVAIDDSCAEQRPPARGQVG